MRNFSINQTTTEQAMTLSNPTQMTDVLSVHSSNQKGNQQHNKKKGRNNRRGGNKKENQNNDKNKHVAREDKNPERKVKFPCKLCGGYHITYLCICIDEASKFIVEIPAVLTDPLPHNQNMASRNMNIGSNSGGHQNPLNAEGGHGCINMMFAANIVTHKNMVHHNPTWVNMLHLSRNICILTSLKIYLVYLRES